jgi:Ca2+-binding EF-hand superfamily protein
VKADGTVGKEEFRRVIAALGIEVPAHEIDLLFDVFDKSGDGRLQIDELQKMIWRKPEARIASEIQRAVWQKPGPVDVGTPRIRESDAEKIERMKQVALQQKVKSALSASHSKVLDLFRQWDENGDGKLGKEEFRKVVAMLGIEAPAHDADLVFDSFDEDGNGFVQINELWHAIRDPVQQHVARLESARQPSSQGRPGSSSSPDGEEGQPNGPPSKLGPTLRMPMKGRALGTSSPPAPAAAAAGLAEGLPLSHEKQLPLREQLSADSPRVLAYLTSQDQLGTGRLAKVESRDCH